MYHLCNIPPGYALGYTLHLWHIVVWILIATIPQTSQPLVALYK